MISNIDIITPAVVAGIITLGIYIPICKLKEFVEEFKTKLSKIEDDALEKIEETLIEVAIVTGKNNPNDVDKEGRLLIALKVVELKSAMGDFNKLRNEKIKAFDILFRPNLMREIAEVRQEALFKCIDDVNEIVTLTRDAYGSKIEEI